MMSDQVFASRFLETADFIGAKLCRDAIWSDQRCNWFGVPVVGTQRAHELEAQSICGSDFHSGTSGIAVFLGRLFAVTGEKIFRTTAEGAIRQALSRLDHFPRDSRIDFYKGLTGVAFSLFEIADSCGIDKFSEMGLLIMEDVAHNDPSNSCADAATVGALLRMYQRHQKDFLLRLATGCGEEMRTGSTDDAALAMLELFRVTGDREYRHAAEAILANDGRSDPGIQDLHKLRAYLGAFELLREDNYATRTREVTERIRSRIETETVDDFSLPKGLSAAGDLFLEAAGVLGDPDLRITAERAGNWGIELCRKDDLPWPCGSSSGWDTPSFMNGLAGIGYFYLRLHDSVRYPCLLFS